ncbi:MAG: hypothetical protein QOJ52_2025 [Acidimicrobiaceae bacterium]|nr:hypothetical protein [Acidimicrobiaceae bacterium]
MSNQLADGAGGRADVVVDGSGKRVGFSNPVWLLNGLSSEAVPPGLLGAGRLNNSMAVSKLARIAG